MTDYLKLVQKAREAYDEDGYCHGCGNGSWKPHAPWCLLADLADALEELLPVSD